MAGYISMDSVSDIKLNGVDVEKITQGVNTLWEKSVIEPFNIKNISQSVATVDWNTGADNRNLQYSEDKTNWTNVPYANNKYSITIPVGKKYYFQGNSTNFGGWWGSDEDVEISGYVLSLHYPTMEQPPSVNVSYQNLFAKNGNGTADSKLHFNFSKLKLPVRRVLRYGYNNTFKGCLSITELNYDIFYTDSTVATAEYAFAAMFQNCTNLTRVDGFTFAHFTNFGAWSELRQTFDGCTSLEYVWDGLFDTTTTSGWFRDATCYAMFNGCTSLTHPPKLPTYRGAKEFTAMFQGCTSLTNATTDRIMPEYTQIGTQSGNYSHVEMFRSMFQGCTGLTSMHDLSSYTMGGLGNAYFQGMYYGCTGITSIDSAKMPSGVATAACFHSMFYGCTGITSVPSGFIKPTNTAESCYQNMFYGCTGITTIPTNLLRATTLAKNCYAQMFSNCTSITAIPSGFMSPTNVAESCCYAMFENCSSLTTIPSGLLPALTMEKNCYNYMFRGCTNLANVPTNLLPATKMAEGCYAYMFQYDGHGFTGLHLGATELGTAEFAKWMFFDCPISELEVDFKEWTSATTEWVQRTSRNGTFTKYEALPEIYDASHIPVGWTVVNKYASETPTITTNGNYIVIENNTYNDGGTIYYTTDGSTPNEYSTIYTSPFHASIGDTIKAICVYQGLTSDVASWTVAVTALPAPTITGNNDNVILVSNDAMERGVLYYTTDGTTPTSSSTQYTGAFQVTSGTTVKAIYINMGGYLYTDSAVTEQSMYPCVEQKFIHNATMSANSNAVNYGINTGIAWDRTTKFRYKGKWVYDNNASVVGVNNNIRLSMYAEHLVFNFGGNSNADYDYKTPEMLDLTVGNKYVYDNNTGNYVIPSQGQKNDSGSPIYVDVTSFMFHSLQIWNTINNVETLVFDGVAAELNGEYGIYDKVSGQLLTRAGITIVPEVGNLYFEDRSGILNNIQCRKEGTDTQWLSLEYSYDEKNWSSWDLTQLLYLPAFGRVYLRGNNTTYGFGKDGNKYNVFNCQWNYALGGDLFSIMDSSVTGYPARFATKTFYQSTTLVDASQLYFGTKTILATTFIQTFEGCENLERVPNVIGVSYASNVNFSTHTSHFSEMFRYDPIANFPKFPNINTIGRDGMLEIAKDPLNTPTLDYVDLSSITTLYYRGLYEAFKDQRSLEVVKIGISAWPEFMDESASDYTATLDWLYGVHSTGVFCKNSTLPVIERGTSYIPDAWSIADLNGKLYDPVIMDYMGTITIAEGGGGSSSTIYYTTDGSDPDTTSNVYSGTFSVASGTVIKAFADYTPTGSNVPLITHSNITTYTVQ